MHHCIPAGSARNLAVAAALALCSLSATSMPSYVCRPLIDEAPGPVASHAGATDINNRQVAVGDGFGTLDGKLSDGPMQWGKDRIGHRLPDDADSGNVAWVSISAINDAGRSVGMIFNLQGQPRAVAWQDGALVELGSLAPDGRGFATAINAGGTIVGKSIVVLARGDTDRATLWRPDGRVVYLGALAKKDDSVAFAINDAGVAVGMNLSYEQGGFTPVRWKDGQIDALPEPPGGTSSVTAINRQEVSVGDTFYDAEHRSHATAWRGLVPVDLGVYGRSVQTSATDINAQGEIIGVAADELHETTPLYWSSPEAIPVDVNALLERGCTDTFGIPRRLTSVSAINDKGVIVGTARVRLDDQWSSFAFRLVPR